MLLFGDLLCQVEQKNALSTGVFDTVAATTRHGVAIGNAKMATVNHLAISFQHTSVAVLLGGVVDLISVSQNALIKLLFVFIP
jgi:hypothetical protein